MAGIVQPIRDILVRLESITVTNQTAITAPMTARVWNNQVERKKAGLIEYLPTPAAFLEVLDSTDYVEIGQGITAGDLVFRVHILHEFYDAQDGTFEQDLEIFGLRDQVFTKMNHFKPSGCGPLTKIYEAQSFDHDNLYEYILDFTAHYVDDTGSPLNPNAGVFITKDPPTELEVEVSVQKAGDHQLTQQKFIIDGQVDSTDK